MVSLEDKVNFCEVHFRSLEVCCAFHACVRAHASVKFSCFNIKNN